MDRYLGGRLHVTRCIAAGNCAGIHAATGAAAIPASNMPKHAGTTVVTAYTGRPESLMLRRILRPESPRERGRPRARRQTARSQFGNRTGKRWQGMAAMDYSPVGAYVGPCARSAAYLGEYKCVSIAKVVQIGSGARLRQA